jgi:hypothetical protein
LPMNKQVHLRDAARKLIKCVQTIKNSRKRIKLPTNKPTISSKTPRLIAPKVTTNEVPEIIVIDEPSTTSTNVECKIEPSSYSVSLDDEFHHSIIIDDDSSSLVDSTDQSTKSSPVAHSSKYECVMTPQGVKLVSIYDKEGCLKSNKIQPHNV